MIDSHCHLNYPDYEADLERVLARAAQAGVNGFVVVATAPENWQKTLELAAKHPQIRAALGVHPHEAGLYDSAVHAELRKLAAANPSVVAVGETGLDFFRNKAPREKQIEAFHGQLAIARELGKPFILHCRSAEAEMLEILEEERGLHGALRGVWHCFTSTQMFAERAAALGLYFGIGGICTYPKAGELRDVIATLPAEKILLETDCPFLPPQPWRGQRNEPSYLSTVVETLAEVRGVTQDAVRELGAVNARALFGI